ncbi:MAG: diguanylate cyclase [Aquabacterium sp.]|jgi:two-component system, sensor histidine kinase LadS|uniref:sensor domain-containing diguanylate cyclase n=1 Tax=Aquabacterium sp. TaxID=1872578 RepID=UPI003BB128C2
MSLPCIQPWRGRAERAAIWRFGLACLLFMALAFSGLRAQASTPSSQPIGDQIQSVALGTELQVLHDPDGTLDVAHARADATRWRDHDRSTFSPGFSPGRWWVRVRVSNDQGQRLQAVLDIGSSLPDRIEVWQLDMAGNVLRQDVAGDRVPLDEWPLRQRTPAFPVWLDAGEQRDLYLRLSSHDGLQEAITPVLRTAEAQASHAGNESLAFGLYFGLLMGMLAYNTFLCVSARSRAFGFYVLHLASFLVWSFTFRGFGLRYLWPEHPDLNNQILAASVGAAMATVGLFQIYYLDVRRQAPRLFKLLVAVVVLNLLCMLPPLFGVYALSFGLIMLAGFAFVVVGGVCTLYLLSKGSRPAFYMTLSFAALSTGMLLYYFSVLGVLPAGWVTEYGLEVGASLQALLLAFGVADRLNTLKSQKLRAEHEALMAQKALATRLDALVRQRTEDLEQANQRLAALSITDELTGAFNRRHFNQVFADEVARHQRHGTPLVFSLFDVDHFKAYNDRYGHQAGDEVLRSIAQAVRQRLRRSGDLLFRLGGEEFGVLLSVEHTLEGGRTFVEELCEAIEAMAITHEDSAHGVVTASFGLMLLGPQDTGLAPDAIYARADELLYQAKMDGRNRVAS